MAKLFSEDNNIKSSFELVILKNKTEDKKFISWVPYKLVLKSANSSLVYEKEKNCTGAGDYVLSLKPVDEIGNLIAGIESFMSNENKNIFSFEPLEPSFELILERSHKGYSCVIWIDAGNVISDHYTWDGFGLRFFTTKENVLSFVEELLKEKKELELEANA